MYRVHDKPYVELKDSDMRPDEEVAKEVIYHHKIFVYLISYTNYYYLENLTPFCTCTIIHF